MCGENVYHIIYIGELTQTQGSRLHNYKELHTEIKMNEKIPLQLKNTMYETEDTKGKHKPIYDLATVLRQENWWLGQR